MIRDLCVCVFAIKSMLVTQSRKLHIEKSKYPIGYEEKFYWSQKNIILLTSFYFIFLLVSFMLALSFFDGGLASHTQAIALPISHNSKVYDVRHAIP